MEVKGRMRSGQGDMKEPLHRKKAGHGNDNFKLEQFLQSISLPLESDLVHLPSRVRGVLFLKRIRLNLVYVRIVNVLS